MPKSNPKDFYKQTINYAPHLEKERKLEPSRSEFVTRCRKAYIKHEDEIVRAYRRDGVIICDYPLSADIDKEQGFRVLILSNPINFRRLRYMITHTFSTKKGTNYYNVCGNRYCCRPSHTQIGTRSDTNTRKKCPGYLTWTENGEKVYYKACTHVYPCKVITDIEDSNISHEKCLGLVKYNGRSIGSCTHKRCKRYNVKEEDLVKPELIDPMSPEDSKMEYKKTPLSADEIEQRIQDLLNKKENMTEEEKREFRNKRAENTRAENKKRRTYEKREERRRKSTKDSDEDDDQTSNPPTPRIIRSDKPTEFYEIQGNKAILRIRKRIIDVMKNRGRVQKGSDKPEEDAEEPPEEEENSEEPEEEEGSDEELEEHEEQPLDTSTISTTQSEDIHADEVEPPKTVYPRRIRKNKFKKTKFY